MMIHMPKRNNSRGKLSTWHNNLIYWSAHLGLVSLVVVNIILGWPYLKYWFTMLADNTFVAFPWKDTASSISTEAEWKSKISTRLQTAQPLFSLGSRSWPDCSAHLFSLVRMWTFRSNCNRSVPLLSFSKKARVMLGWPFDWGKVRPQWPRSTVDMPIAEEPDDSAFHSENTWP